MRSVSRVSTACAATLPVAIALAGCVTTQRVAERARLVDARIRASATATRVARPDPAITVATPAVIHGRGKAAIVVSLTNHSPRALSDLPISVGVRTSSGHTVYLNASPGGDYFVSHVASIGPHATTAWVLIIRRRLPAGRAFAKVGFPALSSSLSSTLPRIEASSRVSKLAAGDVAVSIVSHSAIPQYDFPIYVLAVRDGRYVAAGEAAAAHIGTDGTTTENVTVVGNLGQATLRAIALPTIFS